ncbi:MAG: hypothetical protein LBD53_09600 [Tannerella sp.]|jgi:hypothetical protein|nr:hypothetical protein [Tannerella sp.]
MSNRETIDNDGTPNPCSGCKPCKRFVEGRKQKAEGTTLAFALHYLYI